MTDFSKILDQAKELQNKMKESQEKLKKIQVVGTSGSNDIKVTLSGEGEILKFKFSETILKEDQEIIVDLIKAAHNNARSQLKSKMTEEISKATRGEHNPAIKCPL